MPKSQDILHAIVKSENEAPILYTRAGCDQVCDERHTNGSPLNKYCKDWCRILNKNAPEHHSQEPTPINISNILINIRACS